MEIIFLTPSFVFITSTKRPFLHHEINLAMKRKNPSTSIDAYRALDPEKISQTHQKIINALGALGKGHYEDLAKKAGIKPDSCWKRLSELRTAGLIHRTEERKKLKSGSQGSVWILTDAGKSKTTESILPGKSVADFSKAILNQPKPNQTVVEKLF